MIDEFNEQTTILGRLDRELRERLQGVVQAIAATRVALQNLENERQKARGECSKFSIYFRLLRDWLKVG